MPTLDSTASDLVAQQRDALLERKELAQKTKDFRKLEDSAKLTEYKTLLKCRCTLREMSPETNNVQHIKRLSI